MGKKGLRWSPYHSLDIVIGTSISWKVGLATVISAIYVASWIFSFLQLKDQHIYYSITEKRDTA